MELQKKRQMKIRTLKKVKEIKPIGKDKFKKVEQEQINAKKK